MVLKPGRILPTGTRKTEIHHKVIAGTARPEPTAALPTFSRSDHFLSVLRITVIGILAAEVMTVGLSYLLRGEFIPEGPAIALLCAGPISATIADRGLRTQRLIRHQHDRLLALNGELETQHTALRRSRDAVEAAHEELATTQTQLLAAQKLEAIGSLAAGIAHEINTPIQFISDNTTFIGEGVAALSELVVSHRRCLEEHGELPELTGELAELGRAWEEKDCDFYLGEMPRAIEETLDGAHRVAEIVRAMKDFAHPGTDTKSSVDVNRVISSSAAVSRNEWKQVADMELDLDPTIPAIQGLAGPLGQTMLILFVNAAQAMAEDCAEGEGLGTIRVTTRRLDGMVEIRVADTGPGIPDEIVERIFDPFFTTREVGKGSGQGLSIARAAVVNQHQGEIWVEDGDPGAVFVIRLPVEPPATVGAG